MDNINIITYVHNTEDYADWTRLIADEYASGDKNIKLNWMAIDPKRKLHKKDWAYYYTKDPTGYLTKSSMNHGLILNEVINFAFLEKSDITIIMDCDVALLYKNWDKVVINEMKEQDMFGVEPPPHVHRGNQNVPCIFFMCIKSKLLDRIMFDFSPTIVVGGFDKAGDRIEKAQQLTVINELQSKIWDLPVGFKVKMDTGYKISRIAYFNNLKTKTIPYVNYFYSNEKNQLPFKNRKQIEFCKQKPDHMCEWHYNGKLFCTHKQACRSHRLNDNDWGKVWKGRIKAYMKGNQNGRVGN